MSDGAIMERAFSLVNEAMKTVALQCRRVRSKEPEDDEFVMRWWADLQFLIVALNRFRKSVEIAKNIPSITKEVKTALDKFDKKIPSLKKFRDTGEHIDEYAVDSDLRHDKSISRKELQVGTFDGTVYYWLDDKLNVVEAKIAAEELYKTLQTLRNNFRNNL